MTYLSFPSPPTTLLTAEEAERSIDYIQAELSRVQRACEYRQQHPYDPATAVPGSTGRGVGGRGGGSVPSRPFPGSSTEEMATSEPATRSAKRHADGRSSPASPSPSVSPSSTARAVLSFSEFERRRIAQLLGRVAVELAAVWAYVQQWSSMEERELPAAANANSNAAAEKEGLLDSAVSPAVQRGQSSGQGPTHSEPHLTRVKMSSPRDGASGSPLSLAQQQEQQGQLGGRAAAGLQDESQWDGVAASGPAAQLAALNTLIQTATSIQNLLLGSGPDAAYRGHSGSSGDGGGTPRSAAAAATASNAMTELSPLGDAYQRGRQQPQLSVSESVLLEGSVPRNDASVATLPPPLPDREDAASVADTAVRQTSSREVFSQKSTGRRPAAHAEQPLPSLVVATGSQQRAGRSGSGRKGKTTIAIPDYLRAYVVETSDSVAQQDDDEGEAESNVWEGAEQRESVTTTLAAAEATVNEDEYNGEVDDSDEDNDDDDATMIVNADRGDSRSVSAGSATGIGARPFSRTSDSIGVSHADSSYTSPSSAAPAAAAAAEAVTSPSRPSPAAMTAAHSIMAHHRFDSDMGIKAPSSPFKRLVSGSSLRSSSLIGSPVQQTHQGQPPTRQLSHSTGSAPSHAFSSGHNRSATERSPDSAEMSPAAVAAYSRSTSLLRRPHRLEVPVSRTSSLRRHPTSASPRSATSGSPPGPTLTTATITNSLPSGRPHTSSSGGAGAVPATTAAAAAAYGPVYTTAKGQGGSQHPQPQHQRNSSGSGIVHHFAHGGAVLAGSPPVFLSASAAGDSPSSSSMAGLPFKRVTSVDSEYGGWPPGSLTDSFDMSQWKGSSVSGHPGSGTATASTTASAAAAVNANVLLPVPAAQDAAAAGYPLSGVSGRAFASSPLRTAPLTAGGGGVSGGAAFVKSGSASFGRPTAPSSVASSSHSNSGYMLPARISTPNTNALKRDAAPPPPPLPPHSYKINAQKLTAFLQCVRDLTQTEFSEDEFDSMHLFYFLPGVSLATPQSRAAAEATDCPSSGAASGGCGGRGEEGEAPPLPLFEGGDNVPVRLSKLDVFHSFVVRKVEEISYEPSTMSARPSVSVYSASSDSVVGTCPLPAVFTAPIRSDIVQFVHTNMAKNSRQAYAVNRLSGMNHSAHSWGTGRAVARIPRVSGGGTSTSGAGAFGNMCRGGRMFAPTKIFRRWHRKINLHQKRFAVVSALAASSVPALVMSRGHKIENVPEVPLVVEDSIQGYEKTKEAVAFLKAVAAIDDVNRVNDSREIRAGRGKMRNRRYVARRGPMLVMPDNKGTRAFRNIFGLDLANVSALNLLHLAPGGHVGRFVIWTKAAFEQLDKIFGTFTEASAVKKGFTLPAPMITNTDVTRIMQSEEVRRVLKPKKLQPKKASRYQKPTNGIKNRRLRLRLNPYVKRETAAAKGLRNKANRDARRAAKATRVAKAKKAATKTAKK